YICRMVDSLPKPESPKTAPRDLPPLPGGGLRPGEDFDLRADWRDILQGLFQPLFTRGSTTYWGWADGTRGVKATTGHASDKDRLWVFTTSSDFLPDTPYSKFAAYTLLNHGGVDRQHFKQAAAELRSQGYGTEPPRRR